MQKSNKEVKKRKERLNSFFGSKKRANLFINRPIFYLDKVNERVYKVLTHDKEIRLKTEIKGVNPYVEMIETWVNNKRYKYQYKFTIPHFKYLIGFELLGYPLKELDFQFRYEVHPEKIPHWPIYHLHILDKIPPRYPTRRISLEEFFTTIEECFCEKGVFGFTY